MNIFICYSRVDEKFKDDFLTHIKGLQRQGVIHAWHDRLIDGGDNWKDDILEAIENCHLALLFISSGFLNSEFINSVELTEILRRHSQGFIRVVPIIIRPCAWELESFASLQVWPKDAKSIISHPEETGERDAAWTYIVKKINEFAKSTNPTPKPIQPTSRSALPSQFSIQFVLEISQAKDLHISQHLPLLTNYALTRKILGRTSYFPFCLNPIYSVNVPGSLRFETRPIALYSNQHIQAAVNISPGEITYSFSEHTDWDKCLSNLRIPFLDLLFLTLTARKMYRLPEGQENILTKTTLTSNRPLYLSTAPDRTLFQLNHNMIDFYELPQSQSPLELPPRALSLTSADMMDFFQPIVGSYQSTAHSTRHPFPTLQNHDVASVLEALEQGLYEY